MLLALFCDLAAITWYLWQLPDQDLERWKKILSTVAGWITSVAGFFGIRWRVGKKHPLPKLLSKRPVALVVAALTALVWFFVVPFHSVTLALADADSGAPLGGVRARVDGATKPGADSDDKGRLRIRGLLASKHAVDLERTGYAPRPYGLTFPEVLALRATNRVLMEKAKARAILHSDPEGALIFLDGDRQKAWGTTPHTLELPPGPHTVLFDKPPNYRPTAWEPISLPAGGEATLKRPLQAIPAKRCDLTVLSDPEGATIYIDGVARGTSNRKLKVAAGDRMLELKKPGYEPLHDKVHCSDYRIASYELQAVGQR